MASYTNKSTSLCVSDVEWTFSATQFCSFGENRGILTVYSVRQREQHRLFLRRKACIFESFAKREYHECETGRFALTLNVFRLTVTANIRVFLCLFLELAFSIFRLAQLLQAP